MNQPNGYEVAFGGLTHDVGKFLQRASTSERQLSKESLGLENSICPVNEGRYTHRHVLFTSEFCSLNLSNLPAGINSNVVHSLAAYHHHPSNSAEEIIKEADWLSSGMERIPESGDALKGKNLFRKTRLRSVFADIGDSSDPTLRWEYPLVPLGHDIFPMSVSRDSPLTDLTSEYSKMWDSFVKSWAANKVKDPWGFVNRALGVLEQFTWSIPSATWGTVPDISLYDHLKTTAAISICLHSAESESEPFLFVSGDFGGIQSFIFDIHAGAGGLAKRLRSRSFFVDLAICSIAFELLRSLEVPLTNCLLLSGGKFILLLPNSRRVVDQVDHVKSTMDAWCVEQTSGEVRLNIGTLSCNKEGLLDYPSTLAKLHDTVNLQKLRPLKSYLDSPASGWNENAFLLSPMLDHDKNEGLCVVCQKKGGTQNEDGDSICESCSWDARMGSKLPSTRFIAFYEGQDAGETWQLPFGKVLFYEHAHLIQGRPFAVMGLDGMEHNPENQPFISGYRARHVPVDDHGNVREFDEIGQASRGRKALACLKADVDNMGWLFHFGFAPKEKGGMERRSISRLSTLSSSFTRFFSGYLEQTLRTDFPWVYTLYSGGDDFLCLGPWDQVFGLAGKLRSDFGKYCCQNPLVTISAGIVLVGTKTPINTVVYETDKMLDVSKETGENEAVPTTFVVQGPATKNRIAAFETSLPWPLFDIANNKASTLLNLLDDGEISTAQVRRLMHYSELYRRFQKTGDTKYFWYAPLMVYDLKRNWKKEGESEEYEEVVDWVQSLTVPRSPEMALLRFITEYALYGIRGKSGGDNG